MTREEAHRILECMAIDLTGTLPGTKEPMLDVLRQRLAAINVAQAALRPVSREQVERMRGEWIKPTIIGGRAYNIPHCSACNGVPCGTDENTKFCANCGAPMTDEAVEMVMERLEALKDAD